MARIKICGLRRECDIDYVNELKPDFAGFIMTAGFRRSIDNADELIAMLDKDISSVGVFVNEDINAVNSANVYFAQLHGDESIEYCKMVNKPVIKMLKPKDFDKISDYEPYVDYFLFDSGTGTGKAFDWSMIPRTDKPFFLAGGLDSDNIELAINDINPYAIDLSSSVETDGYKDYDKIKKVIDIVRSTK